MKASVHYKITLVFGIIIAVVLTGVYFYLNNSLQEHTYQRIKTNLLKQVSLTKFLLEENLAGDIRHQEFDAVADRIGKDLNVRVTIINLDGTVVGDSKLDNKQLLGVEKHLYRPEVQAALGSGVGESRRFSTTIKKEMLYVAAGYGKEKTQGIIRLSIPLLEIEVTSNRLKRMLVASFFVAFVLAMIISFLMSLFISKPVRKISLAAKAIAKGDFSKRITIVSNDEIGDLAATFNYMSEQIKLRV
ncbi:MAG: HAMP domain-containing protein, partial [Candidatus Omnitrophota bacterium]|nr:HAMP domain-containing protein [Candidatus Omnitrophota bacterium]